MSCDATTADLVIRYLDAPRLRLELSGEWHSGGVLEIFLEEERVDVVKLPPAKWSLLAFLILAALNGASTRRHWCDTFVGASTLALRLKHKLGRPYQSPRHVHSHICYLRKILGKTNVRLRLGNSCLPEEQWGHTLLIHDRVLGYRINVHPNNLRLRFAENSDSGCVMPS